MRTLTRSPPLSSPGNGSGLHALLLAISLLAALSFPRPVEAYPAILEVSVNSQPRGSFFVETSGDGEFLMRRNDLVSLGLPVPQAPPVRLEGEDYFSLSDHPRLNVQLNEQTLTLEITVAPELLPLNRLDFTRRRPQKVYTPREDSFFVNYGVSASGNRNESLQALDVTHEAALRMGHMLWLTDGYYTRSPDDAEYIRLLSRMIHDDPETLRRTTFGDQHLYSGPLGNRVLVGGAGYGRNFDIDPYYIYYPAVHMRGTALTPSRLEVYLDGTLIRQEDIPPGPFLLENISRYEGAGEIEVIIRDAFNRERVLSKPFYLAENLLQRGTHEYAYGAGALREEFGTSDSRYGDVVAAGLHRYGLHDWVTLGIGAEAHRDFLNLTPRLSLKWGHYGYIDLTLGASAGNEEHHGHAAALEYSYRRRGFSTGLFLRHFSTRYARLDQAQSNERPELEAELRLGFSWPRFGSLNLSLGNTSFHTKGDRKSLSLSYNRRLSRETSLFTTVNRQDDETSETSFLLGLTYAPRHRHQYSARYEERKTGHIASLDLKRDPPVGTGYGYRGTLEYEETQFDESYTLNGAGEYRGRHVVVRGEADLARRAEDFAPSYLARLSGAVATLGGETFTTRPIRDSFALVKVGSIADIGITRNASLIGTTDEDGQLPVPELTSYYESQIGLRDTDLPIEYGIETSELYLRPPLRGGACITFAAQKIQPLIGRFVIEQEDRRQPYEYRSFTVRSGDVSLITQTGHAGEFYIDLSEAGEGQGILLGCNNRLRRSDLDSTQRILIEYNFDGTSETMELVVPASEDFFIEFGEILLRPSQHKGEK